MDIRVNKSGEVAQWIEMNFRRKTCTLNAIWLLFCIYLIRRLHWQSPFHWTDSFIWTSSLCYSQTVMTEKYNNLREDKPSWATKLLSKEITLKDVVIIQPSRCTNFKFIFGIKLYVFRTVPLPVIRSFSLYTQQWYMYYRLAENLFANCQHTCMTYAIAVCTVKNSWWWTEELSETCRVLFQK